MEATDETGDAAVVRELAPGTRALLKFRDEEGSEEHHVTVGDINGNVVEFDFDDGESIPIDFGNADSLNSMGFAGLDVVRPATEKVGQEADVTPTPGAQTQDEGTVTNSEGRSVIQVLLSETDIVYGDDAGTGVLNVELPPEEQLYSIEHQLDDLLSAVMQSMPGSSRSSDLANRARTEVQRFQELREEYSHFDSLDRPSAGSHLEVQHRPLVAKMRSMDGLPGWMVPVSTIVKKLYGVDPMMAQDTDVDLLDLAPRLGYQERCITDYLENRSPPGENPLFLLLRQLAPLATPYDTPSDAGERFSLVPARAATEAIVNNGGEFLCTVAQGENTLRRRMYVQRYTTPAKRDVGDTGEVELVDVSPKENVALTGWLTLPLRDRVRTIGGASAANMLLRALFAANPLQRWRVLNPSVRVDDAYSGNAINDENCRYFQTSGTALTDADAVPSLGSVARDAPSLNGRFSVMSFVHGMCTYDVELADVTLEAYKTLVARAKEANRFVRDTIAGFAAKPAALPGNDPGQSDVLAALTDEERLAVTEGYQLPPQCPFGVLWNRASTVDGGRLLFSVMRRANADLITPNTSLENVERSLSDARQAMQAPDRCSDASPAKEYLDAFELQNDNGKDVYFDASLDPTDYTTRDMHMAQSSERGGSQEEAVAAISRSIMESSGLDETAAEREATAIVEGRRLVVEGDVATLPGENGTEYYIRRGDVWVLADGGVPDASCIRKADCLPLKTGCRSGTHVGAAIRATQDEDIVQALATSLLGDYDDTMQEVTHGAANNVVRASRLVRVQSSGAERIIARASALAQTAVRGATQSPYAPLRDAILGQHDITKRHHDVIRFCAMYTRAPKESEIEHWLYCVASGSKLMPAFLLRLAEAFLVGNTYGAVVEEICRTQGALSDDGESWVDKHSGYVIMEIGLESEEGYGAEGERLSVREVLDADLGGALVAPTVAVDPVLAAVENVIRSIARAAGTDVESQIGFATRLSTHLVVSVIGPTKETYARNTTRATGKRKVEPYEKARNKMIIVGSAIAVMMCVKTAVPPLRRGRGFPGCFVEGLYDAVGDGTMGSSFTYMACVAVGLRSRVGVWSSLGSKTTADDLAGRMRMIYDAGNVGDLAEVRSRIQARAEYDLLNPPGVDAASVVAMWSGLLPPLETPPLAPPVEAPTAPREMTTPLIQGLITRDTMQVIAAMNTVAATVTAEERAHLTNSLGEPYTQNSCCSTETTNSYKFFEESLEQIPAAVSSALALQEVIRGRHLSVRAPILYDPSDTQRVFPPLAPGVQQETVLRCYIYYCRYRSHLPPAADLMTMCRYTAANTDATTDAVVMDLIASGHPSDQASLDDLMRIVASKNMIVIPAVDIPEYPPMALPEGCADIIGGIDDVLGGDLAAQRTVIERALATRDAYPGDQASVELAKLQRATRRSLGIANETNRTTVTGFMVGPRAATRATGSASVRKLFEGGIAEFDFSADDREESLMTQKTKEGQAPTETDKVKASRLDERRRRRTRALLNAAVDLAVVIPLMVVHNSLAAPVRVPRHWGLSQRHEGDVRDIVGGRIGMLRDIGANPTMQKIAAWVAARGECIALAVAHLRETNSRGALGDGERGMNIAAQSLCFAAMKLYIDAGAIRPAAELDPDGLMTEVMLGDEASREMDAARLLSIAIAMTGSDIRSATMSYEGIESKVHRLKEREKVLMTDDLKALSDEEREVEKVLKSHKLGTWGVGLQKGFRVYQGDTYDAEREEMTRRDMIDAELGENADVLALNRDLYNLSGIVEAADTTIEDGEAYDISDLPDDDDYGDMDGDEAF